MPSVTVTDVAKFAVTVTVKPWDTVEKMGHGAIDALVGLLSPGERSEYDGLVARVAGDLEQFTRTELGRKPDALEAILATARDLFAKHALGPADLVALRLRAGAATSSLLDRGAGLLVALDEGQRELCRKLVRTVYGALLDDPRALDDLRPAFMRAVLDQGEAINRLPDEVARAMRAMAGEALLVDPSRLLRPGRSYTALLRPEYGIVPWHTGREGVIEDVTRWCEDGEPARVRLFVAEGGIGKTRLMIELCRRLRRDGWQTGFLDEEAGKAPPFAFDALFAGERDLFIVSDYAESRRTTLDPLLRRVARAGRGRKIRVVLLVRAIADWWPELQACHAEVEAVLDDEAVIVERLEPLADTLEARRDVYEAAVKAFAAELDRSERDGPTPDLSAKHFAAVLFLHIAALATVLGDEIGDERRLLDGVLERERRRAWPKALEAIELPRRLSKPLGQAAALITLAGGAAGEAEGVALLRRLPRLADQTDEVRGQLIDLLRRLYPGARYLEGIRPDLLGEHLVDRALEGDPWLVDAAFGDEATEGARAHGLTVLTRLAKRRPETERWLEQVFEWHLHRVAEPAIAVAVETGDPVGRLLADSVKNMPVTTSEDFAWAYRLMTLWPDQTVALRELRVTVTERCLTVLRGLPEPDNELRTEISRLTNNLSIYLSALGRHEAALAAAEEAVTIRRELALPRPDAFRPGLAMSLNNLANRLSTLGRREEALAAAEEAARLYRELAALHPDAFPDLVMSLNNLANLLGALGRHEEALAAAEEAARLYRELATMRPDAFRPYLATSLNNLANLLGVLGRQEAALAAAEEAVAIRRELALARPDAFRPGLAMSLNNLANRLSALGRREAALTAVEEAARLYRELAMARPDAFRPDLAGSINNLANRLAALGRREEAVAAAEEAVAIRRELALPRPDAFQPDLAMSLSNLANFLAALGRREEALIAAEEAVAIRRELALARPDAFWPDLAMSLNNLANLLGALGRHEAALAAAEEAARLYRELAAMRPDAFRPDLATSLNNLANLLSRHSRQEEALATAEEAVTIRRELAAAHPDAFRPELAWSLSVWAGCLDGRNRHDEALSADAEAVAVLSPHFEALPGAFASRMSGIVRRYLRRCEKVGREPDENLLRPIAQTFARLQGEAGEGEPA